MNLLDNFINECDIALKTLSFKKSGTGRSYPPNEASSALSKEEKNLSAQLMRVNLAGEEETDHLIWCKKRLEELNGKPSILNPVWYAGSFAIGAIFGSFGEKTSLGFVEETEKQVVKHLERHLDKVSKNDIETIEILKTMRADEDEHAQEAVENGSESLSEPTKRVMSFTAKVMTSSSAYI